MIISIITNQMAESISSITWEKLNKDNYPRWKLNLRSFLKGQGLWEIVIGDEEVTEDASQEEKLSYIKKSNQALHWISVIIRLSLI